ncbi:MlaD family protein [Thiohalorhabdus sp.]|uniref:MlaD family protein n=1 Tax=Thiohalorhabdus sp. TaxID=3094134 RepID=UPI002FC3A985
MENRAHALLAVFFLVLLGVGGAYLYYWMKAPQAENRIYHVVTDHSVGSLRAESEVTYKGLVVGHVKAVRLHPENPDKVRLRLGLRRGIPVTEGTYTQIQTRGLTGATYLALKKDPEANGEPLPASPKDPARLAMRPGPFQDLMDSAQAIAGQIQQLSRQLTSLTGEGNRERIGRVLTQAEDALDRWEGVASAVRPGAARLDSLMAETEDTARQGRQAFARIAELAKSAQTEIEQVGEAAQALKGLGRSGEETLRQGRRRLMPRLDALAQRFDRIARNLAELSQVLRVQPQSAIFGPSGGPTGPGEEGFQWQGNSPGERP